MRRIQHPLKMRYREQRGMARLRGIPFLLTFPEWMQIWRDSGHLHHRGCRQSQYVMARFNDAGPYAIGNVKIIPHTQNSREWIRTAEYRARISSTSTGRVMSAEARAAISRARKGKFQGGHFVLNADQVREIRSTYVRQSRACGQVALAKKYGVKQAAISAIVLRKTWRHVT